MLTASKLSLSQVASLPLDSSIAAEDFSETVTLTWRTESSFGLGASCRGEGEG